MIFLKLSLKDISIKANVFRCPAEPFSEIKSQLRGRIGQIYPLLEKRIIFIPKFNDRPEDLNSCFIVEKISLESLNKDIGIL